MLSTTATLLARYLVIGHGRQCRINATTPSTNADPSADYYTQAFIYVLCSEEIVRIVERAVHQERGAEDGS